VLLSTANTLPHLSLTKRETVDRARNPVGESAISELTARLKAGDETAFREFHARYFERLYCFLLVIARGHEDEAQEALQQTLLRVVRYARIFHSEEVFWSWLKALARSAARDAGRKQQRYIVLLQRFALFQWRYHEEQSSSEDNSLQELVHEILNELSVEERHLVEGKYLAGESVRELSARSGLTEKAVEARLSRLRQHLRERLLAKLQNYEQ
jgi:RNA polymerase sigma-70 factor (ECF subfamily)